jgi:hypothetical protein
MSRDVLAGRQAHPGWPRPGTARRAWRLGACASVVVLALVACSPVLDWREAHPAEGLTVLFPCKPDQFTRQVPIAGAPQAMTLWSCSAGDLTFAVSQVEASEPARVPVLLQSLRTALSANLGGRTAAEMRVEGATVPGATPHPLAQRLVLRGRKDDGTGIEAQAQFFCHGMRVFQATVIGGRLDPQALEMFFSSLKIAS